MLSPGRSFVNVFSLKGPALRRFKFEFTSFRTSLLILSAVQLSLEVILPFLELSASLGFVNERLE